MAEELFHDQISTKDMRPERDIENRNFIFSRILYNNENKPSRAFISTNKSNLNIKWQSFDCFSVIVIYWQSFKSESFCRKPHQKIPTRCGVMPVKSQIGHFSEMKYPCYYK